MIAFLESDALKRPTTVAADTAFDTETGRVTSTISQGELFLHPEGRKEERYRLHWAEKDKDRGRPLPVGTYVVTGYRHVAAAKDEARWVWSTTSGGYDKLEVRADDTTHFAVRTELRVRARAIQRKGKHRVGLVFQAEKKLGNTLYRDGKRIPIEWQLLDGSDEVLSKGKMRYG